MKEIFDSLEYVIDRIVSHVDLLQTNYKENKDLDIELHLSQIKGELMSVRDLLVRLIVIYENKKKGKNERKEF